MATLPPRTSELAKKAVLRLALVALLPVLALACGGDSSAERDGGPGGSAGAGTPGGGGTGGGAGANGTGGIPGTAGAQGAAGAQGTAGTQGVGGVAGASGSAGVVGGAGSGGGAGGAGGRAGATGAAGQGAAGGGSGAGGGLAGRSGNTGTGGGGRGGDGAGAGGFGGAAGGGAGSGGRGGAGAGGTGGGTSAYNPCPTNGDPCKILPLGDSITHGVASSDDGGYRSQLFKLIVAASQKVTFTGSLTNGPTQVSGQNFPRNHEGHDGWTIDPGYSTYGAGGISSLIPSPALNGSPHIILLHIGTNDTGSMDSANMSTRLEALLDKIAQAAPTSLIVLAQIAPLGYNSAPLTTYNTRIPGIVQSHSAKGQHIVGVDMTKLPVPADIASDNVHPNDQGYAYMANIWYAAIKNLLPH
jgi:lysophospholipase L1-like esterase